MAKRNKKATRKIERLRDRLHHADENPDFKVGWLTQYMFVMDNFDIGETKRANENRWLYTIGPQRRTRYPFETLVIPGTHYTLHWFMQCKLTDPSQVPEFKYVPISTGATTLPFGTAPYVPTVQISQTKSDWVVVPQEPFFADAKIVLQCLAKTLNQHNFTIFDARDLTHTLPLKLPLISHEETICELEFLERQRKGIVIGYQNRYKRKCSPMKYEEGPNKRPRLEVTNISSATRTLLDLLSCGPATIPQAAQQMQVKEKLIEKVVDVLMVVGHVTISNGVITLTQYFTSQPSVPYPQTPGQFVSQSTPVSQCLSVSPRSPKSPASSCEDSFGPIPETPPQSMPMWDSSVPEPKDPESPQVSTLPLAPGRPYATRSSTKALQKKSEERSSEFGSGRKPPSFSAVQSFMHPPGARPPLLQLPAMPRCHLPYAPPPTEPARPRADADRVWPSVPQESGSTTTQTTTTTTNTNNNSNITTPNNNGSTTNTDTKAPKNPISNEFESGLDLNDSSVMDFFQTSFWDQY